MIVDESFLHSCSHHLYKCLEEKIRTVREDTSTAGCTGPGAISLNASSVFPVFAAFATKDISAVMSSPTIILL